MHDSDPPVPFHDTATLVELSQQSYLQNTEDVRLRDRAHATT